MQLKKPYIFLILGWVTTTALMGQLVGYYHMQYKDYTSLLQKYEHMYNNLSQNYTRLLEDYVGLLSKYEAEKANYTELIQKYESVITRVNICIDYKEWNATVVWYNDTIVPLGCDLLQATKIIAIANCTYYPSVPGWFVDAINGVWNKGPYSWMWYFWDQNEKTWKYGAVGADSYILKPDETIMWRYEIPSW